MQWERRRVTQVRGMIGGNKRAEIRLMHWEEHWERGRDNEAGVERKSGWGGAQEHR